MPESTQNELSTIDAADLTDVTGGNHRPGHTSGNNTAVTAALTSVTDSLRAISNKGSGNHVAHLLPFMLLANRR